MFPEARGKSLYISKHAHQGMWQERPPLDVYDIILLLEEPDHDDGKEVRKRLGRKTIRAYYHEGPEGIEVYGVSRTSRAL